MEELVKAWLEEYQAAVRTGEPKEGTPLFSESGTLFGVQMNWCKYLPEFAKKEWGATWPRFDEFTIGELLFLEDWGDSACCAVTWSYMNRSEGLAKKVDGRGTFVFQIQEDRFVAIHCHLSLAPENE